VRLLNGGKAAGARRKPDGVGCTILDQATTPVGHSGTARVRFCRAAGGDDAVHDLVGDGVAGGAEVGGDLVGEVGEDGVDGLGIFRHLYERVVVLHGGVLAEEVVRVSDHALQATGIQYAYRHP
jgi:hypothetical protein